MASDNNNNANGDGPGHSQPIPIEHSRRRSASTSSSSASSGSSPSSPLISTPLSLTQSRLGQQQPPPSTSPSTSPILSYFMMHSPSKQQASTFPFKRSFAPPVFEDEENGTEPPVIAHTRRASTAVAGRFGQLQSPSAPNQEHRGHGLLRRLSLGGAFAKPQVNEPMQTPAPIPSPPPNSAVTPSGDSFANKPMPPKARRATLAPETIAGKPRRAPSPMGERILKGHFDGFN